MAKILRCGDLMPGCNAVIEGRDDAEVMAKAVEHAKKAHGMVTIPPALAKKVQAAIRDKKTEAARAPSQDEIASRAYEIYLSRGASPGRDLDDWLEAERELQVR